MGFSKSIALLGALTSLGLSACNGVEGTDGQALGSDGVNGTPQNIPNDSVTNPPRGNGSATLGDTCQTNDANQICLSLKYVAFTNSSGKAVVSEAETLNNLETVNKIWSQCNIQFEIGEYLAADPTRAGLNYNTLTMSELSKIRQTYQTSNTLLVVTTGNWAGTLGAGSANAWAAMPGSGPYGVVMEGAVATYGNIVAHELGHYLNLGHHSDPADVMSAIIYNSSTKLTTSQCDAARSASLHYWTAMTR